MIDPKLVYTYKVIHIWRYYSVASTLVFLSGPYSNDIDTTTTTTATTATIDNNDNENNNNNATNNTNTNTTTNYDNANNDNNNNSAGPRGVRHAAEMLPPVASPVLQVRQAI